jgi:cystathionine gamma-lyase
VPRQTSDFFYSRLANPTRSSLEECLASLDDAKYALAFSAGVSAITAVLTTLKLGDGIISSKYFYSGTTDALNMASQMGFDVQFIDFSDLNNLKNALKPNTKLVWAEPSMNPTMNVSDTKAIADIVHSHSNAYLIVDNTFLTPYYHRPLELGADLVIYSVTKYFGGHSDVTAGSIATNNEKLYKAVKAAQNSTGTMASPFDCYLINRSLKTLSIRMERHSENAYKVARWLQAHPKIEKVNHPALRSYEGHEISLKQCYGHSGIFSFYIKGNSYDRTQKFYNSLKTIWICTSFGGVETSVSFPREMSHLSYSDEEAERIGVTNSLVRISTGIEDVHVIIADLEQALEQI